MGPFFTLLLVKIEAAGGERAPFGYIIYEHGDESRLGVPNPSDNTRSYFCTKDVLDTPGCTQERLGQLLHSGDTGLPSKSRWTEGDASADGEYPVPATGYYCVRVINPTSTAFKIHADFVNPYGELPAEYRPLMSMSLLLCLLYLMTLVLWSFSLIRYSRVVASFQKYVAGMLALSALEQLAFYLFYAWYNARGSSSSLLLTGAAVVGATRMTAALFILLIVAMGYGTVLASLEDRARSIYALSLFYLAASLVNIFASLTSRTGGQLLLLLSTLGVVLGGAAFFTWTFDALKTTIALLLQRKQYAKLEMYYKLTSLLKALYTATILCMILSVLVIAGGSSSQAWYARHWSWLWLLTDGWQSILNLVACLGAAYIFRPRANNRTHDMNQLSSEPLDDLPPAQQGDDQDVEAGPADMKLFKLYEQRQRQQAEQPAQPGYERLDEPDWARPEDPFGSDDARK